MMWVDILGWFGVVCVVVSYAMVALQRWHVRSIPNQLGNLMGAGALGFNCIVYKAWVPAALNVIWALIALYTLFRLMKMFRFPDF